MKEKIQEELPEYLYKYMTFENFIDVIENKRLYLTNITMWDDVYEGKAIDDFFNYVDNDGEDEGFIRNTIYAAKRFKYAQSWKYDDADESDAMWRIYSPQKTGVRIKVSAKKVYDSIIELLTDTSKIIYYYGQDGTQYSKDLFLFNTPNYKKIEYIKNIDFKKYRINKDGENIASNYDFYSIPFEFYKRKAFIHEKEYRFSIQINPAITSIMLSKDQRDIEDILKENEYLKAVLHYDFENIDIKEILLDPRTPEYFMETFDKYCEHRGLKDNGTVCKKSGLYTIY
ncbi:hypothetical protein LF65_02267 [Clostridium beijerinckii]|uniref:DUF2971 domain-containing protein n=1 Tax=Clostridium beijerinckii TaxID=1520 RepID=A0A0B5QPP8_CLOBE|nr:DUF2971 domain-containing protein [Clostridium beijerinckii]AJG98853.1 hypothetical protein LF65_02267 [Clostridium beijerinckii]